MRYVIFDIDGTIADNTHRQHYVAGKKKDWKGFLSEMDHDEPIQSIITLIQIIHRDSHPLRARVMLVTGRPEYYRPTTFSWLTKHKIFYDQLLMRKDGDHREDWLVKEDILKELIERFGAKPIFVVDDRQQVVDMWRRHKITCLQPCAPVEF